MFRPGLIEPLDGIKSKTSAYRAIYAVARPLFSILRWALPNQVVSTRDIGRAMLNVALQGYAKKVLEPRDIRIAAIG
jgi:hypothetical protein